MTLSLFRNGSNKNITSPRKPWMDWISRLFCLSIRPRQMASQPAVCVDRGIPGFYSDLLSWVWQGLLTSTLLSPALKYRTFASACAVGGLVCSRSRSFKRPKASYHSSWGNVSVQFSTTTSLLQAHAPAHSVRATAMQGRRCSWEPSCRLKLLPAPSHLAELKAQWI